MNTDTNLANAGLAFLVGAVILPVAFFGLLQLARWLDVSGDGPFFVGWLCFGIVVATFLVVGTSAAAGDLLAGLTLGISVSFVGVPALLDRPHVVIVGGGLFATVAVFLGIRVGRFFGGKFSDGTAFADGPRGWAVAVGFVVLVALTTLIVDATSHWYQTTPEVYRYGRTLLFVAVLLAGVTTPRVVDVDIRTYLTAIALHPFLVFIWVFGGPFPVDETTMRTAVLVTGLLLVGATISMLLGEGNEAGGGALA